MKRTLSLLLVLIMVLGLAAPSVQASETNAATSTGNSILDGIYIPEGSTGSVIINGEDMTEQIKNKNKDQEQPVRLPNPSDLVPQPPTTSGPVVQEVCQCADLASLKEHSGVCMIKAPYMQICEASAEELCAQWGNYTLVEQSFMLEYLQDTYPAKVFDLQKLLNAPTGSASETLTDGTTVSVEGIPQDGSLTVGEAADAVKDIVDAYVAENEEASKELFSYDVSVQDGEGADWQPETNVKMELELPGAKLHKYTKVYVVHVDDNGVASTIEAQVTEDGKIAFETPGFSAFYGFTVDFDYEGVQFSIPGMSSIKLSELFENLKMPLDAQDVVNVEYTDDTQLKIEKLEGDWLLTSLKAFTTEEKLTLTLADGSVYQVKVTDATDRPTLTYNGSGNLDDGTYGSVEWYMTATGSGYCWAKNGYDQAAGWNEDYDIIIDGSAASNKNFEIVLQRDSDVASSDKNLYVDLNQIKIKGGANVTIRLGASITKANTNCVFIRQVRGWVNNDGSTGVYHDINNLFDVENGSLTIKPSYADDDKTSSCDQTGVQIWVYTPPEYRSDQTNEDWTSYGKYAAKPYVYLGENATSFTARNCEFYGARTSAIWVYSKNLVNFNLINCNFGQDDAATSNVCYDASGQGGNIYVSNTVSSTNSTAVHIQNMTLTNTNFYYSYAGGGRGGAIYIANKIDNLKLDGCTFKGTYSKADYHGGAIAMTNGAAAIEMGSIEFKDCTFNSCKVDGTGTYGRGGAIYLQASNSPAVKIDNCTFTGNSAGSLGGAFAAEGTLGAFTVKSTTSGSTSSFSNNTARGSRGGAISLDCSQIGNILIDTGTNFTNNKSGSIGGALDLGNATATVGTIQVKSSTFTRNNCGTLETKSDGKINGTGGGGAIAIAGSTGAISIAGESKTKLSKFTNCTTWNGGGAIFFQDGLKAPSITLQYLDMDGCRARDAGGAIHMGGMVVRTLTMQDCTVQNCGYFTADMFNASGYTATMPSGYTTTTAGVFSSDEGGGTVRTVGNTTCVASIKDCQFLNNKSELHGGGVYWNASGLFKDANGDQLLDDKGNKVLTAIAISGCTFDGNYAGQYGGGIYCEATMTIEACELKNNIANQMGGGIAIQVYNNNVRMFDDNQVSDLTLDADTTIHHNQSANGGGVSIRANATTAIANDNPLHHTVKFQLNGAQVYNNYATENGGGVLFDVLTYTDDGNQQEVERFSKNITLDAGSIYNNTANKNGGGVYMNGGQITDYGTENLPELNQNGTVTLNITGVQVYGNVAGCAMSRGSKDNSGNIIFTKGSATGGNGGGIYLIGQNAVCSVAGGVIGAEKKTDGTPGTAHANIANTNSGYTAGGNGGGIAIYGGARIEMNGGYIVNNTSDVSGGGISVHTGSTMLLENGNVENNTSNMGGGISLNGATGDRGEDVKTKYGMYVNGGVVKNNKVYPNSTNTSTDASRAFGGGICISDHSTMLINNGEISYNKAVSKDNTSYKDNQEGGGVAVCQGSNLEITGGVIKNNEAYKGGGMTVRSDGQEGNISKVTMTGSTTVVDGQVTEYTGAIVDNYAENSGGGVFMLGYSASVMTMNGGYIYSNEAKSDGGGVSAMEYCHFTIDGGRIDSNKAYNGGGIYTNEGIITVSDGVMSDNEASCYGGAICNLYSTTKVSGGEVYNNRAVGIENLENSGWGGAIYTEGIVYGGTNYPSKLTVSGGYFYNNTAAKYGGALAGNGIGEINVTISETEDETEGESGGVTGATFTSNHADLKGGALYNTGLTVEVSGGTFTLNTTDGDGAAICNEDSSFTITNGKFTTNTAQVNGGGMYLKGGLIDISGGTFTGNVGKSYGGGAYFKDADDVTFTTGTFTNNASMNGGGLCIDSSTVNFTGGLFEENVADNGGALYVRSSTVTIGDITVKTNYAKSDDRFGTAENQFGGGLYVGTDGDGVSSVTINGGTFTGNTAKDGAGIYVDGCGQNDGTKFTSLTLNGGTVGKVLEDGKIAGNIATGNGGGVYAGGCAKVFINGDATKHGEISYNTAKNGGGVYVTTGANLTVSDGYITYNKAVGPDGNLTSAWHENADLYGTGGGICVTSGNSVAKSTFVLTGKVNQTTQKMDVAIYGNTATFAADDVFASGNNTQLTVPAVANMNLAGYGFKPEGWFEDYPEGDKQYTSGLDMITKNGGTGTLQKNSDGTYQNVYRYRAASAADRRLMHILPEYVSTTGVNKVDTYVCMTLGIPAAADDTVVIDFGSKVTINLWENDLFMDQADFGTKNGNYGSYMGSYFPTAVNEKDGVYYSTGAQPLLNEGKNHYHDQFNRAYGEVKNSKNGLLTYTPNTTNIASEDQFYYVVKHNDIWYYAYVTIVPATTIYYEDNMSQVTYHTDSTYEKLAGWDPVGNAVNGEQDEDRPGAALLDGLDADNIYGYDSSYASTTAYSNGSAHKVTVNRHTAVDDNGDGKCDVKGCGVDVQLTHDYVPKNSSGQCKICLNTQDKHGSDVPAHECSEYKTYNEYCDYCGKWIGNHTINARATFTFTGTGFDIVSLCSAKTGIVMVSVYKGVVENWDEPWTNDYVASYMVDTYYGYDYVDGKWTQNTNSTTSLYQVPVIQADLTKVLMIVDDPETKNLDETEYKNFGYGTYSVELYIAPSFLSKEHGYWNTEFILDGIRIYNPAGYSDSDVYVTDEKVLDENGDIVYDKYGQPVYVTRPVNNSVVQDTYKADGEAWPVYQELRDLFLSSTELTDDAKPGIFFIDGTGNPSIKEYKSWGPNNEVYLNGEYTENNKTVQGQSIGFFLDSQNYEMQDLLIDSVHIGLRGLTGAGEVEIYKNGTRYKTLNLSTTDLYYDISELMDCTVTIKNTGTTPVSISNVKITHKEMPESANFSSGVLFSSRIHDGNVCLSIYNTEQLTDPVLKPKYPALSFEGMVSYNVFFTAEDLGNLTSGDLGLAVFDSYNPEGTVENAKDVIMGATQIDGLYMVATNGVHAKYLGDTQYFRAFAKKADGSYVYSKMVSYSALDYAKNVLAKSNDVKLKQLVVAMLNYGAEAQKFFGYKTDDLMNKNLTVDQQALVSGINAGSLNAVGKVDASKVGVFASNGGFAKKYPAISFKGAFEINYFMEPSNAVDGDMTLYCWNEDTYNSATQLTADNADKVVNMVLENDLYTASSDQIAAKDLDETVYVAAVYKSNGISYCSGVLPYSIAAYCQKPSADVAALANAAAVYGCTAKEYFGA